MIRMAIIDSIVIGCPYRSAATNKRLPTLQEEKNITNRQFPTS